MNNYSVFDIETDGLIENATKIHCLSVQRVSNGVIEKFTLTDYNEMRTFLSNEKVLIGHNIIRFDIPIIEKILGKVVKARLIDTLGLSWYLYPMRVRHGLEFWGNDLGIEKPKIQDWEHQTLQEYIHRCESDVEINIRLWRQQFEYLNRIYTGRGDYNRLIGYLGFKLECAREQEEVKWKLNREFCETTLKELIIERDRKMDILTNAMPANIKYKTIKKPKAIYRKDNSISISGEKWLRLLADMNLPSDFEGTIDIVVSQEPGNPKSTVQLKDWLFGLGWKPCTFEYKRNKETGEQRKIPQVYDNDGGITPSVKLLYEKEPLLENLDGLTIINHRIGILQGFLKNVDDKDFLKAEIIGFTNTLRFQHTTINIYCGRKIA